MSDEMQPQPETHVTHNFVISINRLSERKRRLFAVACVRQIWDLLDERSRKDVEVAERYADGLATEEQLYEARNVAWAAWSEARDHQPGALQVALDAVQQPGVRGDPCSAALIARTAAWSAASRCAWSAAWNAAWATAEAQAALRDEVVDVACAAQLALLRKEFLPDSPQSIDPTWLACNNGTVAKIAAAIYQDKCFQDAPILADALEETGCTVVSVLKHLRSLYHVRGCWAMDLLLDRS